MSSIFLPQNWFSLCLIDNVLRESFEEFRIFSLVNSTEDRSRSPASWVNNGAISDLCRQVIAGRVVLGSIPVDYGVADETDSQTNPKASTLVFGCVRVLCRLKSKYLHFEISLQNDFSASI